MEGTQCGGSHNMINPIPTVTLRQVAPRVAMCSGPYAEGVSSCECACRPQLDGQVDTPSVGHGLSSHDLVAAVSSIYRSGDARPQRLRRESLHVTAPARIGPLD